MRERSGGSQFEASLGKQLRRPYLEKKPSQKMAGRMAQAPVLQKKKKGKGGALGMVVHICNPSIREAKARRSEHTFEANLKKQDFVSKNKMLICLFHFANTCTGSVKEGKNSSSLSMNQANSTKLY
jgi:hypothetical protein